MQTLPLIFTDGHLFVEAEESLWLYDTGAPTSFGDVETLAFAGEQFRPASGYMGLDASMLSGFVGVQCSGLLGADILGRFDHLLDVPSETLTASSDELSHPGTRVPLSEFMGIPIVTARIGGTSYRMFFDTGAQISYLQDDSLADFPSSGTVTDFFPGVGEFETDTHQVDVRMEDLQFTVRCGTLPGLLGLTLMMADTQGIIGNQVLADRLVGYFPRSGALYL